MEARRSNPAIYVCGTGHGTERGHCGKLLLAVGNADAEPLRVNVLTNNALKLTFQSVTVLADGWSAPACHTA
jgi:hypothetical protein